MRATWYILENGSNGDPQEVAPDAAGVLRHRSGVAVAMRGDVPRTRGVDVAAQKAVKPSNAGYATRVMTAFDHDGKAGGAKKPDDASGDLASLRSEYQAKFGKKPFAGWDAAQLKEKIEAAE